MTEVPIRDAASVVLVRRGAGGPQVLMGQRGSGAVFMPSKFVFPGGAVDPEDVEFGEAFEVEPDTGRALLAETEPGTARGLPVTAIRELWEEAGLALARPDPRAMGLAGRAPGLAGMLERGLMPDGLALRFFFRAITPPGRPRRFDARFFLAEIGAVAGDPEDFSRACDELSSLQWVDLAAARALPLPFITEVVLAEVGAVLREGPRPVPFFRHDRLGSHIELVARP